MRARAASGNAIIFVQYVSRTIFGNTILNRGHFAHISWAVVAVISVLVTLFEVRTRRPDCSNKRCWLYGVREEGFVD